MIAFDRRGEPFRSFDGAYSLNESGDKRGDGRQAPVLRWTHVTASNIQNGNVTRVEQVRTIDDHRSGPNDPAMYDRYLTQGALMKLGVS